MQWQVSCDDYPASEDGLAHRYAWKQRLQVETAVLPLQRAAGSLRDGRQGAAQLVGALLHLLRRLLPRGAQVVRQGLRCVLDVGQRTPWLVPLLRHHAVVTEGSRRRSRGCTHEFWQATALAAVSPTPVYYNIHPLPFQLICGLKLPL